MLKNLREYVQKDTVDKRNTSKNIKDSNPTYNTDSIHSNIVYTNDRYNTKMNKTKTIHTYSHFKNVNEFEDFINKDIESIKNSSWNQLPFSIKYNLCKSYIDDDNDLNNDQKIQYTNKLSILNINDIVLYDKHNNGIKKMYYNIIN